MTVLLIIISKLCEFYRWYSSMIVMTITMHTTNDLSKGMKHKRMAGTGRGFTLMGQHVCTYHHHKRVTLPFSEKNGHTHTPTENLSPHYLTMQYTGIGLYHAFDYKYDGNHHRVGR